MTQQNCKFNKPGYQLFSIVVLLVVAWTNNFAIAHEFWIAPKVPNSDKAAAIKADIKVGQKFFGNPQVYLPSDIASAGFVDMAGRHKLTGTAGDQPVFNIARVRQGLTILYYEATAGSVEWKDAAKFKSYLENEGLSDTLVAHKKRGLPDSGFSEDFLRYAKALVQRGTAKGNDRALGLDYEIVLKTPIEKLKAGGSVKVQVSWHGEPARSAALIVFSKKHLEVERQRVTTNENGIATFAVADGTFYLLNSVHIVPVSKPEKTYWQSHWASLTFAVGNVKNP